MKSCFMKQFNRYCWSVSGYRLEFSDQSGALLSLGRDGLRILDGDNGLSPLVITVGGTGIVNTGRAHLWNIRDTVPIAKQLMLIDIFVDECSCTLHVLREGDGWFVDESYHFNQSMDRLERNLLLRWNGREECLLRWVEWRMPTVASLECMLCLLYTSDAADD